MTKINLTAKYDSKLKGVVEGALSKVDAAGYSAIASCVQEIEIKQSHFKPVFASVAKTTGKIFVNGSVSSQNPEKEIIAAIANLAWSKLLTASQRLQWASKLIPAPLPSIRLVEDALSSSMSYDDALSKLATAVDRLVGIHVFNALKVGNVRVSVAKQSSLSELPQVSGFATGEIPFSLIPLLSAYSDGLESFDVAVADLVLGTLSVSEFSTKIAVEKLIKSFFV